MKYRYIERCAKGQVEFQTSDGLIVMPTGEAVEVPDSLAKKLANNNHFEAISEDGTAIAVVAKRRGRPPKQTVEEIHDAE